MAHFYTEHFVVHSVISILPDTHRCGHHLEHVLCHDTLVLIIFANVSECVERQMVIPTCRMSVFRRISDSVGGGGGPSVTFTSVIALIPR